MNDDTFLVDERLPNPARLQPSYPKVPRAAAVAFDNYGQIRDLIHLCRERYGKGCLMVEINFADRIEMCRWITTDLAATRDDSIPVVLGQIYPADQLAWVVDRLWEAGRLPEHPLENAVLVSERLVDHDLLPLAFLIIPIGPDAQGSKVSFLEGASVRWSDLVLEVVG